MQRKKRETEYFVYIVRCKDNSLYTGQTTDLARRITEHNNSPKGAKYTSSRRPVELVYYEGPFSIQDSMRREREIKALSKGKKEDLVNLTLLK